MGGERKFNQNKKVGSRLSKGEKSEPMLTSLVNTGMKKWNHPLVPFIWIGALVGAGSLWLVQEGLPLYWAASLIMPVPDKWYGRRALHPWPQGPPTFKGCNALLPGLSPTTIHRNLWIKFHKMTNYFMLYFILFYCIFTPGGWSSKKLVHNVLSANFTIQDAIEYKVLNWIELKGKTDLKSLPQTVWSLESEVWILSHTIASIEIKYIGERERERERVSYRTLWVM
jgi:hypothetical protein